VDLEVEAQRAQLFEGFVALRAREGLLHGVRLRNKTRDYRRIGMSYLLCYPHPAVCAAGAGG